FSITPNARLHWLIIFEEALQPIIQESKSSDENIQSFWDYLNIFSLWMINARDV
ncbi:MAG: globin, partial [Epsilonproteobacteria bacterium]